MNTFDNDLAHLIMIKFGTSPQEPSESQLAKIKASIKALGRVATEADWRRVVQIYCPGTGRHFYAGLDNSDLNTLLSLALQATQGR